MSSEAVESQIFIMSISSVLKLTHRKAKIYADLSHITLLAVHAYWENGDFQGFTREMDKKISSLVANSNNEPLLTEEPQSSSDYNLFMAALYQEVYSFFEVCALQDFRFLAYTFHRPDSTVVIFTKEPVAVSSKSTGFGTGEIRLHRIEKVEDE